MINRVGDRAIDLLSTTMANLIGKHVLIEFQTKLYGPGTSRFEWFKGEIIEWKLRKHLVKFDADGTKFGTISRTRRRHGTLRWPSANDDGASSSSGAGASLITFAAAVILRRRIILCRRRFNGG